MYIYTYHYHHYYHDYYYQCIMTIIMTIISIIIIIINNIIIIIIFMQVSADTNFADTNFASGGAGRPCRAAPNASSYQRQRRSELTILSALFHCLSSAACPIRHYSFDALLFVSRIAIVCYMIRHI